MRGFDAGSTSSQKLYPRCCRKTSIMRIHSSVSYKAIDGSVVLIVVYRFETRISRPTAQDVVNIGRLTADGNGHVSMYRWNSALQEKEENDVLTTSTKLAAVSDELSELLMFESDCQRLVSYHGYSGFIMSRESKCTLFDSEATTAKCHFIFFALHHSHQHKRKTK